MNLSTCKATVVLLTFNGRRYLEEILASLQSQETDFPFEVLVIDSGSTDETVELVRKQPWVQLAQIPNEEFQHGRTRNLAASWARGEIVAYLTQSSTPVDSRWLSQLVGHFDRDERIVAVYGKHVPRSNCRSYVRLDIERTFRWISPTDDVVFDRLAAGESLEALPAADRDRRRFYSDANSALRKSYWQAHPYPEVDYAEDQLFGAQVLRDGFVKVYDPQAAVYHSHNLPLREFFMRRFDEFAALRRNGEQSAKTNWARCAAGALHLGWRHVRDLWRCRELPLYGKLAGTADGLPFAVADAAAAYLAARSLKQPGRFRRFSHERMLKGRRRDECSPNSY